MACRCSRVQTFKSFFFMVLPALNETWSLPRRTVEGAGVCRRYVLAAVAGCRESLRRVCLQPPPARAAAEKHLREKGPILQLAERGDDRQAGRPPGRKQASEQAHQDRVNQGLREQP